MSGGFILKPCAFCGWDGPSFQHIRDGISLECRNRTCGASVRAFNPAAHEECAANWNTRTPSPREKALEEALRQIADALPDDIDLFRIIRLAGRSNVAKSKAVHACLTPIEDAARALLDTKEGG